MTYKEHVREEPCAASTEETHVSLGWNVLERPEALRAAGVSEKFVCLFVFQEQIMLTRARTPRGRDDHKSLWECTPLLTHRHIRFYTASQRPANPENTVTVQKSLTACNLQTDRKCLISTLGIHQTYRCAPIRSFTF